MGEKYDLKQLNFLNSCENFTFFPGSFFNVKFLDSSQVIKILSSTYGITFMFLSVLFCFSFAYLTSKNCDGHRWKVLWVFQGFSKEKKTCIINPSQKKKFIYAYVGMHLVFSSIFLVRDYVVNVKKNLFLFFDKWM